MQKVILMLLMICSLSFSNEINYTKKILNDTTVIVRLQIPEDSLVYTCLTPDTYANTIKKLKAGEIASDKFKYCEENLNTYNKMDSLYSQRNATCDELSTFMKKSYDDVHAELLEAEALKYNYGAIGMGIGILVSILIGSLL